MTPKRVTVAELAKEAALELDEALIALWDAGFDEINGPTDVLRRDETKRARRALGLATRRELGSPVYWQGVLRLAPKEFWALLEELGAASSAGEERLSKRAIHRLNGELRRRGLARTEPSETTKQAEDRISPLVWVTVGHPREIRQLSIEEVEGIHKALVEDFEQDADPIDPPGVRSDHLLASALNRPLTAIDGIPKYSTVEMAAAALLHALVHNHPFHNGNKRTALVAMLVLLDENGLALTCDEDRLFKLVLKLAQHALAEGPRTELADRETLAVAHWLADHSRVVEKGDRTIPWRRLRRILTGFGCRLEVTAGNKINIARTVTKRSKLFGRERSQTLRTQTHYGDEGREVEKNTINKIRRDLELDDDHGIDSAAFYDDSPTSPSEFIVRYRKTLRRLARL